jgi:CRP/FNR family cyclic AMP-dependent transcriptional regulator
MLQSTVLQALVESFPKRRYRKDFLLIQEGEDAGPLYILLSGRLQAFSFSESGKQVIFGVYDPIDVIGELALDGGPRSASVLVMEEAQCVVVPQTALREAAERDPALAWWLLQRVIQRARSVTEATRRMALLDVYGRLRAYLSNGTTIDGHIVHSPRPTQQAIADQLGASREMVSRLMKDLEQGGYLQIQRQRITVLRPLPARW